MFLFFLIPFRSDLWVIRSRLASSTCLKKHLCDVGVALCEIVSLQEAVACVVYLLVAVHLELLDYFESGATFNCGLD